MELEPISRTFWHNGFVVIPAFFPDDRVREIEGRVDAYCRTVAFSLGNGEVFYEEGNPRAIKSLFQLQEHDPYFLKLARNPQLISLMKAILPKGRMMLKDVAFFGKTARDGSVTPTHQDNAFNFFEPPLCLKASLAIDDATEENGVMICQHGSHKIGVLPHRPSGVLGFSQMLVEPLDMAAYPEAPITMQRGDLALHHTNTVHRSGPNSSEQSRRMLSIVYRSSMAQKNEQKLAAVNRARNELYKSTAAG